MTSYRATLHAEFIIEAENIVQARAVAKAIRSIGERVGARSLGPHDKHMIKHRIECVSETVTVDAASPASRTEETPAKGTPCGYCAGWVGHPDVGEACIRDPVRCVGMPGYTGDARAVPAAEPNGSAEGDR